MRGRDDLVVFGKVGRNKDSHQPSRVGHSHQEKNARKSTGIRHSLNFLSEKKVCLRECCRVKRQIQKQLSKQRLRKRQKMDNMMRQRSIDNVEKNKEPKNKKQSFAGSRLKTINHEGYRKMNKTKIYFLPHLKEFDQSDVIDGQIDHEARHKVKQSARNSALVLFSDEKQANAQARPLPLNFDINSSNYHTNKVKTQNYTTNVDNEMAERTKQNNSYIDRHQIYRVMENRNRPKEVSEDQRTTPTRPYYKYLQNYPKHKDQYATPQRRPQLLQDNQPNPGPSSAPNPKHQNTLFHCNKLRVSMIKSGSKIITNKQMFQLPSSQEQVSAYLLKYQPIQLQFNLRMLVKKDNFQVVRGQGFVYCGQIKEGKKHGKGILLTRKQLFQGLFDKDFKSNGAEKTKAGIYIGPYVQGKRHGIGQFKWSQGQHFEGEWKNGKKEGHGVWRSQKGNVYEGEWKNNRQNGKGTYLHVGGSKYIGYFKDFLKHGRGEEQFANGDRYAGDYSQGKPHGYGTYTWINGDIYKGDFQQGSRQGKGTLFYKNGIVYQGDFFNDKCHGQGKQKYEKGEYFEGQFHEGQKISGKKYSKKGEVISQLEQQQ